MEEDPRVSALSSGGGGAAVVIEGAAVEYDAAGPGPRRVLELPSFRVERGEAIALAGPSGCGKTTLLSVLAGLRRPARGAVALAGVSLDGLSGARLDLFRARHVGIVFQSFNLLESSPVRLNVALPLRLSGRAGPAADAWVEELLARVGLEGRGGERPPRLSAGERQRVAVARAVAGGPDVLLADEPTGSLDEENARRVMDLLFDFARGRAMVVATHDRTILSRFDRVVEWEARP